MRALAGVVVAAALAACAGPARSVAVAAGDPTPSAVVMSDPEEYRDRGISAALGEEYFTRLGGGDPYATGMAFPVWLALLESFPEELGGDVAGFAAKFGFLVDPAHADLPVGMHLTTDPGTRVPFVVANCQLCHAERLRLPGGDRIVSGLGSVHVRVHAYDVALVRVARAPALSVERLLDAATRAARAHDLPWPDGMGLPLVRATLAGLRARAGSRGPEAERLASGLPGRVATIESFAMALRAQGHPVPPTRRPGWAKIPDVRGFAWRDTLSWDGVGTGSPVALAAEADFAFGARPQWFDTHRHIGTSLYLFLKHFERRLRYPGPIDAALVERGHSAFDTHCARCHGDYTAPGDGQPAVRYRERIVPVDMVGTDPARVEAVTPEFVAASNAVELARGLTTVAPTGGYVPPVLQDVWARGLYGHAGQWPSIEVLAMRPPDRPRRFVVDPDAPYDVAHMGLSWSPAPGGAPVRGYAVDVERGAPGVDGHWYLAELSPDDRRVILEYLKTL